MKKNKFKCITCVTSENNYSMFNKLPENYLVGRLIQT